MFRGWSLFIVLGACLAALVVAGGALASQAPQRGYVVAVEGEEVTIDLGQGDHIQPGQVLQVLNRKKLKHPVTGKVMFLIRPIGRIQVTEVQQDLSLAKVLEAHQALAPGQLVRPLSGEQGAAAAPARPAVAKPKPAPRRGDELWVAVMPPDINNPAGSNPDFDAARFQASRVARALGQLRRIRALALTPAKLARLGQKLGVAPQSWNQGGALPAGEQQELEKFMQALGVQAVLWWGLTLQQYEDQLTLDYLLRRQGKLEPVAVGERLVGLQEVTRSYPRELLLVTAEGLGIF